MQISELISLSAVIPSLNVTSKKQALQEIAKRAAELSKQPQKNVLEALREREQLGTTSVGRGVAIPHGKLPDLDRVYGLFVRLEIPINFDGIDGLPVDILFALLAPATAGADHLRALAQVSCLLRDHKACEKIRSAAGAEELFGILTRGSEHSALMRSARTL